MRQLYKAEFVGDIKIESLDPTGYKVSFNFDRGEHPTTIISDLPDEEFLPFIKEELRVRKFQKTKYYNTSKIYPTYENYCK